MAINIGVAAHITAAARGGPRYDPAITEEDRKSANNGIWLCQSCSKLIDSDVSRYPSKLLNEWKITAEAEALASIGGVVPRIGTMPQVADIVHVSMINQLEQMAEWLSTDIEKQLEIKRKAWREGHDNEAITWLRELTKDTQRWRTLTPRVKAKIMRFEASIELGVNGNIERAKQLADDALKIYTADNQAVIRALIARRESGPDTAFKLLEGQEDIDTLNLKATLLIEMGRVDEALEILTFNDEEVKGYDK